MAPPSRCTPRQENHQKLRLRKPAVEKMRRERINTGIERLKLLLKDQLNPRSKLEKADILETAVAHLKKVKEVSRVSPKQCYADGFTRCLQETARFLFTVHNRVEMGRSITMSSLGDAIHHKATGSIGVSANDVKRSAECTGAIWRPW